MHVNADSKDMDTIASDGTGERYNGFNSTLDS